jgi:hypothetical protein
MKFRLLVLVIFISCQPDKDKATSRLDFLDTLSNIQTYSGDSITLRLTEEQLDNLNLGLVDSLFYQTYMTNDKNFYGFNVHDGQVGGPDCQQYYYGLIKTNEKELRQVLVLQRYYFNDNDNSLLLMTFDNNDSLTSVLQVASLVFQADIEPNFSSTIYPDKVVKQEITRIKMPEDVDTVGHRELFCADSVTKTFRFTTGKYELTKRDSARNCAWKKGLD